MHEEIPDLNLFMICKSACKKAFSPLPDGFYFSLCQKHELDIWKAMPFDDDETAKIYYDYMTDFFNRVYSVKEDLFYSNCLFVRNKEGMPVATCFIWKAYNEINTVHWLKVKKEYEGLGIGRALLSKLLSKLNEEDLPLFLHTQPSSYRAIKLYSDFGFNFISNRYVGHRKNDIEECLPLLRKYMPESSYTGLKIVSAPEHFLNIIASSTVDEF